MPLERGDQTPASKREFALYWIGFVVMVAGVVSILSTISGVLIDVLSYQCWYPVISPLLGVSQPADTSVLPYYCVNPAVALIRFVFNFLAALTVAGAGFYMTLNGKRK